MTMTTMCEKCGEPIIAETLEMYDCSAAIGFPAVFIANSAIQFRCGRCAHQIGVHIPDAEGLEVAVAMARVLRPAKLTGKEVRFIRKACGLRAKDLAESLEVRDETVSRWENDKEAIGPHFDKLIRCETALMIGDLAPGIPFDKRALVTMKIRHLSSEPPTLEPLVFQRVKVRVADRHETEWELEDKAA